MSRQQAPSARDWRGVAVRELLGPRDLSYAEATKLIGERIGRPDLAYVQFSHDDMVDALVQEGFSKNVANLYAELDQALNDGQVKSRHGRTPHSTTPTRFEDFVDDLSRAYQTT